MAELGKESATYTDTQNILCGINTHCKTNGMISSNIHLIWWGCTSAEITSPQLMSASTGSLRAALLNTFIGLKPLFPIPFLLGTQTTQPLCCQSLYDLHGYTIYTKPIGVSSSSAHDKECSAAGVHKQSENQRQVLKWCSQVFHVRVIRMIANVLTLICLYYHIMIT